MDEYIVEVTLGDFREGLRIQNFDWPDLISILFDKKLRGIFELSPHLISAKCSVPNPNSIKNVVFKNPYTQDLTIEIFETYYEFSVFGFYEDGKWNKKWNVPKIIGVDVAYEKYKKFAFDTSYTNDHYGKNGEEYFGTISIARGYICDEITGNNCKNCSC